ncbi:MAG: ABC transporter ATP-binding protein/permease, partial [Firmicutes bacterium]|nr:ABC transporter ATP-binding protein/permease [Bacillota bacterium]
ELNVRRTVARIWSEVLRPHMGILVGVSLLVAISAVLGLVPPLLLRTLIDRAIPQGRLILVEELAIAMLIVPIVRGGLSAAENYLNVIISQRIMFDLRNRLYHHGQLLGLDFFTSTRSGEIHSRFLNDVGALQQVLSGNLVSTLSNFLTLIFTVITMFYLSWRLAVVSIVALPSFAFPVLHFGRRRYQAVTDSQKALSKLTMLLEETLSLSGQIIMKGFGTQEQEREQFRATNDAVRKALIRQSLVGQWLRVAVQVLSSIGPALLYGYGGYLAVTGRVKVGTVVAFAAYLTRLYAPASSLAGINTTLMGGLALFDRIFRFIDIPVSIPLPNPGLSLPRELPRHSPAIEFERVTFGYHADRPVLHDLSFNVEMGTLVAMVGPSGAGKSTVQALMARFYDPTFGIVKLAGIDLREVNDTDLRQIVGMVTQDIFLFHTSLWENITYGSGEMDRPIVQRAVEAAQLEDLVARLPQGLDTVVGERGYRLSGGEKQRVAIARAIVRNPAILLLDEATSSLDTHAERRIQEALSYLFHGRTVVAIAHRLSTVMAADKILVLSQGYLIEQGRHHDLVQANGLYASLYREQFRNEWEINTASAP